MLKDFKDIPLDIVNAIDWEMTPEESIAIHLEWGQLRNQKYYMDKDHVTIYFCVYTWKIPHTIQLIKRKGFDVFTLGTFDIPEGYEEAIYKYKGVYELSDRLKDWIKNQLNL